MRGDQIGSWRVEERLGRGGVAEVYRCTAIQDPTRVAAIKQLRTRLAPHQEQAIRRLRREAEVLVQLDHPGIVRVHRVVLEDNPPWLEMSFVPGAAAVALLRQGPTPAPRVVDLAIQLFEAMAHWHGRGIAHRDIKPGNLIVGPRGRLVVVDFGLALDPALERLSDVGVRVGTVAYAPPEWVLETESDPASWDVYGAGQVLYELLVGQRAYDPKKSLVHLMQHKAATAHLDPGAHVPEAVRSLVRHLTQRDPTKRPRDGATALEVLAAVRAP